MAAWIVLLVAYGAACTAVALRRRRARRGGAVAGQTGSQGWGFLLPFALAGFPRFGGNPVWSFIVLLAAVAAAAFGPALAAWVLPYVLLILGVSGFVLAHAYSAANGQSEPSYGFPLGGAWWGGPFVLLEACAFTGAAMGLLMRSPGSQWSPVRLVLGRPVLEEGTAEILPWGLLLVPVLGLTAELLHNELRTAALAIFLGLVLTAAALALVRHLPAVAADLAVAGLVGIGIYGLLVALRWPEVSGGSPGGRVLYGAVFVQNRPLAWLAGLEGLLILGFGVWLVPRALDSRTLALLWPRTAADAGLTDRVEQLKQTRADAVDTAAAELRRVERDLHDGAQARLVALGMSLRAAQQLVTTSPQAAQSLITEAIQLSARALTELRDLVRGIHPPVLADRGLADAIRALALDTPLPTGTDIHLDGRPDPPIESACYFAVAELLANAVKHAGARHTQIWIRHERGLLRIEVSDDGSGGADPAGGSGLAGLTRRLGTFDGTLTVRSPQGGPTLIVIEVPCALSSPKISSY